MSLWKIAWRSLQQRRLSSVLTCLSMALGVALVVTVLLVHGMVKDSFERNAALGYHLVVGGKNGSKLDLVLSTVYHLGIAEQPMPYHYYKKFIKSGEYAGYVELAVPICLGDNYEGYRVVGTTPKIFDFEYADGQKAEFAKGKNFQRDGFFQAVLGAEVARKTDLGVGDTFQPTHNIVDDGQSHMHQQKFTIVGVLKPTGTPNDRVLFINMDGFYLLEGHSEEYDSEEYDSEEQDEADDKAEEAPDHKGHDHGHVHHREPIPDDQKKVTAILVLAGNPMNLPGFSSDLSAMTLAGLINKGDDAQAAQPVQIVQKLLINFVRPAQLALLGLTVLTVIVAGIGVMVSIYNAMAGRRHEIAVMRALGARRGTVMSIVFLESMLISLIGGVSGVLISHSLVAACSPLIVYYTGVPVAMLQFEMVELAIIPTLLVLATIVGYLPAMTAYRTDVVKGLSAAA